MMRMGELPRLLGALAMASLCLAAAPAPSAAQAGADCRCVDRDGNEIESCSCLRVPRVEGMLRSLGFSDARPRLGISVDVRQSARRDATGALVTDVLEDGPADEVGLRRGDVITSVDGRSLLEPLPGDAEEDFDLDQSVPVQRLLAIAEGLEPGQSVEIEYLREGESRSATVEAEDLSTAWGMRGPMVAPGWDARELRERLRSLGEEARVLELRRQRDLARVPGAPRGEVRVFGGRDGPALFLDGFGRSLGLDLVALNPSLGSYFGADEGVLVADVDEDSALGLRPGDVVLGVGDRDVTSPERLRRILESYGPEEDIALRIRRDGREMTVSGRLAR